ncbi:MAG: prephenate dehydrogenase/arogenate dehydrogenase family protein [Salinisphaera sp.]|jgi:prephenate dehydrogenase|nr:prephenate dehydrogenase/arogenate dehydrogenase family protein [Salinisphaera sp.]
MPAASTALPVRHVAIVGLGLIGGSIARGLRHAGYDGALLGLVADAQDAERALALELVDRASDNPEQILAAAELIVVAVPIGVMDRVFTDIARLAPATAVLTDVGSSKSSVIQTARDNMPARMARFVPGHPISGTERGGLESGFAGLFDSRRVILTPTVDTTPDAMAVVAQLWRLLGAQVSVMDAMHHDDVLAATSHLPHVLAYTLVDTLAGMSERQEIFDYAAGGFRDFTRIASSDPMLWRDIVCSNRAPVLAVLDRFIEQLSEVRQVIADDDRDTLAAGFTRAKQARDQFAARFQERRHGRTTV